MNDYSAENNEVEGIDSEWEGNHTKHERNRMKAFKDSKSALSSNTNKHGFQVRIPLLSST